MQHNLYIINFFRSNQIYFDAKKEEFSFIFIGSFSCMVMKTYQKLIFTVTSISFDIFSILGCFIQLYTFQKFSKVISEPKPFVYYSTGQREYEFNSSFINKISMNARIYQLL